MDKKTDKKKSVTKYTMLYMSIGMCFGVAFGVALMSDNISLGMSIGLPVGMCIGLLIGQMRDRKLSENMLEISRMQPADASTDTIIYAVDENGAEKEYTVTEKKMKEEKFAVGDRVAEESNGVLVSLESK